MTPDEQRMREIEQAEQWFRKVCRDPEPPDADRINRRVRIAINEEWLDRELGEQPSADLTDRAKRRVWAAVAAEKAAAQAPRDLGRRVTFTRRFYQWAGGLGVAAAACLLAYVGFRAPAVVVSEPSFESLIAFHEFHEDELGESLAALADDLTELELAFDALPSMSSDEEMLDDLFDTIEDLMREGELDWSAADWS